MAPDLFNIKRRIVAVIFLFTIASAPGNLLAVEPEYFKPAEIKSFTVSAGAGYGISNNLCRNCDGNSSVGGATFAISLGYKINDVFKIEFGPSFWIEGNDLINKNVADSERPNNKRTTVTFAGTCAPFKLTPVSFKIGIGAGILNYTPEKNTVMYDENKFNDTEIFKGFAGSVGIAYEFRLCQNIKINPSINFWYLQLETPDIRYSSYINYKKSAITTDLRLHFNYHF